MTKYFIVHRHPLGSKKGEENFLREDFGQLDQSILFTARFCSLRFNFRIFKQLFLGLLHAILLLQRSPINFSRRPLVTLKSTIISLSSALRIFAVYGKLEEYTLFSYWGDTTALTLYFYKKISNSEARFFCRLHHSDCLPQVNENWSLNSNKHLEIFDKCFFVSSGIMEMALEEFPSMFDISDVAFLVDTTRPNFHRTICDKGPINLISISRNVRVKRWDRIFHFAQELSHFTDVRLHICGDKNGHWDIEQLSKNHVNVKCVFHDFVDEDEKNKLFSLTNSCLINLSESEGLPHTFYEAMKSGVPIICTDLFAYKDISRAKCIYFIENVGAFEKYSELNDWIRTNWDTEIKRLLIHLQENSLRAKLNQICANNKQTGR